MTIVDTTVWIDFFNGINTPETDWLDSQLTQQRFGLLDLVLCEYSRACRRKTKPPKCSANCVISRSSKQAASISLRSPPATTRHLRRQGRTVRKTIDCLIATFCINAGHGLLHCDRDFDVFEQHLGLSVIHPPTRS